MTFAARRAFPFLVCFALAGACDCGGDDGGGDGGPGRDGSTDGSGGDGATDGGGGDGSTDGNSNPDVVIPPPPDVHVVITADNAYGFGYGDVTGLTNYFMGMENGSSQIFNCSETCDDENPCSVGDCDAFGTCNDDKLGPETYIVPGEEAGQDGYLYVITWSDESVTQGLIGQFRAADGNSPTVYTGSPDWEVCATGNDIDLPDPDPTLSFINTHIAACNAGVAIDPNPGTPANDAENPSLGWIGTELGNNPKGMMGLVTLTGSPTSSVVIPGPEPTQFNPLCRATMGNLPTQGDMLDSAARWMWFDENVNADPDAFHSNGQTRGDFLIWRLPISAVIIIE